MPCTFSYSVAETRSRPEWRSSAIPLRPEHNQQFTVITDLEGGGCGYCRQPTHGIAWGSSGYVLCPPCAIANFGAPDLRIVRTELFTDLEETDDTYEDSPSKLVTKRDKDFDPSKYQPFTHHSALFGRNGCSGYRCTSYAAPERTIPRNTRFMLGADDRGYLCIPCYEKLKAKFDALPERPMCPSCERRVAPQRMVTVVSCGDMPYTSVCGTCIQSHYLQAPETDGIPIYRGNAVWAVIAATEHTPMRRLYASRNWATAHWFQGRDRWYTTEAEANRELYAADEAYRRDKLAREASQTIFSYGTNIIKMHGFPTVTKADSLCFGVELEMQPNKTHGHLHLVSALGGKWVESRPYILCRDGSIGDNGVEMITLPYTLADHKSDKYMPWTKVLADLRQVAQSGKNTTACGMHVHMNKRALSNLQMGKMLVIINAPEMQELVTTIAQRSDAAYARRFYKKVTEGGKIIGSHSDALNMSNNKGTVELRIFRGNLRYERVMKNLEFAEALCMYANEQSIQKIHDPDALVAWLEDNRQHYPHLVKFVREEYQPTKAFKRTAAKYRANSAWHEAPAHINIEPTEGDI